jgi:hypothetical protein
MMMRLTMQANSKMQTYESRDYPGRSKYLYLLILQDYTTLATMHLRQAEEQLAKLAVPSSPAILEEQKAELTKDLNYLAALLKDENERIRACLQEVRFLDLPKQYRYLQISQIKTLGELKHNQIARVMTLIVAVYVPLAFVTSYFGMNVKEFTGGGFISVKKFWQISVPLVVATIGLPLIATIVARTTVAITAAANSYSRRKWPFLVNFALLVFFAVYVYVRASMINQGDDTPKEKPRIFAAEINWVIAVLALLKTIERSIHRKKSARREFFAWLGLTVTAVLCAGLNRLNTYLWRMALIPFLYLIILIIVTMGQDLMPTRMLRRFS